MCLEVPKAESLELRARIEMTIETTKKSIANPATLDDSGTVPDLETLNAGLEVLESGPSDASRNIDRARATQHSNVREPFRTETGRLRSGLCRTGDDAAAGSNVPLILRPVTDGTETFQFVG